MSEKKLVRLFIHRNKENNSFLEEALKIPWEVAKYVGYEHEVVYEFDGKDKFKPIAFDGYYLSDEKFSGEFDVNEANQ